MTEILVLDDDLLQLKILARQLNGAGYHKVVGCTSAAAALKALSDPTRTIGLIFLDLNMPGVDGVAFLRLLAEHRTTAAVVLVSGEDERLVETALRLGASHHLNVMGALPKPVWTAELRALLARWAAPETPADGDRAIYSADEIARAVRQGELVNYYQPIVALDTGALVGVEALVRWRHPRNGLVLPEYFIDLAEAHGVLHDITRVVMRAAFGQARAWHDNGLDLQVAVNVAMSDLDRLDFFDLVLAEASSNGLAPSSLTLEINESRLASGTRATMEIVSRLRLKRVTMSIDDFGTGQSSLAQLRDQPFNQLKVDGSFVHGASINATHDVILASSLKMARHLGMTSVGEGLEDRADWDWLRRSGCDLAQGHFVARPMPAAELLNWHGEWEKRSKELVRG